MSKEKELREVNAYELAILAGGEGMIGMDGSGNDWECPQQLGSLAVETADITQEEL